MSTTEVIQGGEAKPRKQTPGTLRHIEYLAEMPIPAYFNRHYVPGFFKQTQAERSLAILIKQQRTYRPIRSAYIDFDSRVLDLDHPNLPLVRGAIHRNPSDPNNSHLIVHGQSKPWRPAEEDFTYDFFIPTFYNSTYDRSRPISASFSYGQPEGDTFGMVKENYDEIAAVEYSAADPKVLVRCIKQASRDFSTLMNYMYYGIEPEMPAQLPSPNLTDSPENRKLAPGVGWAALGLAAGYWASKATSRR